MPEGRPTELTPEVVAEVRRLLPTVLYLETVADYLGVDRTTWRKWLKRGAQEARRLRQPGATPAERESLHLEFFHTVKSCIAQGEIRDAAVIKKAARSQWQAAAWRLERRFRERWGSDRAEIRRLEKQLKQLEEQLGERRRPPPEPEG